MSHQLMSRRQLLALTGGLAAAGGLFGVSGLARSAVETPTRPGAQLRIGYLPITDAAPLLIAHSAGLYPPDTVSSSRPVLFRSWAALAEAFITRQVDIVHLLMPMAVQLRYSLGAAVRILGWNHTNGSALTVAPHIRELSELAGTQVGIPFWWSIHNIVLQRLLRAHGLRPVVRRSASRSEGTVELIVMSPSDMVPALANQSIGGYVVADPFNAVAQIKKIGHIAAFLGDVWREHACCVLLAHEDVIERHPEQVQAVTDAVVGAQLRIGADRAAAASTLAGGYLPQPVGAIRLALTYPKPPYPLVHPEWEPQRIGYQPFPFPSYTEQLVEAMGDTVVDGSRRFLDGLDPARVHGELVDDVFVRRSLDKHGGAAAFGLDPALTRTEQVQSL